MLDIPLPSNKVVLDKYIHSTLITSVWSLLREIFREFAPKININVQFGKYSYILVWAQRRYRFTSLSSRKTFNGMTKHEVMKLN